MTGMPMANASLLDEATAAAEAMAMSFALTKGKRDKFFVSDKVHPQTLGLIQTRADALSIEVTCFILLISKLYEGRKELGLGMLGQCQLCIGP